MLRLASNKRVKFREYPKPNRSVQLPYALNDAAVSGAGSKMIEVDMAGLVSATTGVRGSGSGAQPQTKTIFIVS